jgi:membrane-associated phospholipid phosphatase
MTPVEPCPVERLFSTLNNAERKEVCVPCSCGLSAFRSRSFSSWHSAPITFDMARSRKKAKREAWNRFADTGRAALVGAATVLPQRADTKARVTAGECFAAIKLITHLLKKAVPERRPDGDNNKSFPSEHAAVCVAAAIIIEREYSGEIGAAAWALAAAVGLARIESKKHYPRDVIAGALIGCASVWISLWLRSAVVRRVLESS